ncbi:4'-phosphopantetheinyl transferase superfamily protein [Streptacidiphilus sp. P02-A3a]|uniref:4'-phosphopantetheinyl transferase family protein n=1 Tax=Streptacidiphilus sp. P02-A3a TaxID=2704468 RepID=UPI0015FC019E|nr:hypothetical protein [Streptacidiphilus sp. P02-A3a]QMU70698.1 hypothetical protein GXP74_23315 [Streptacidiphilus sp. P02-A3a]
MVGCDWAGVEVPERLLGDRERAHAAGLGGPRRVEWVRARLTAKAAVRWATGRADVQLLPAGPHGAPRVLDRSGAAVPVTVSLAHTAETSLCAVAAAGAGPWIGVDLEPVDPRNEVLLPRLLAAGDEAAVPRRGEPGQWATDLVTCKEAALKAYLAPSLRLRDYRLVRRPPGELWVLGPGPGLPDLRLWLRRWPGADGGVRVAALCAPAGGTFGLRRTTPAAVLRALSARPGPVPPRSPFRSPR